MASLDGRHGRLDERAGRCIRHGGLLPRDDLGGVRGATAGHGAAGDRPRLVRGPPRRSRPRQALDRRRRRYRESDPRPPRRGLWGLRAHGLRPGPGPHGRHAGQAREHPGLRHGTRPRPLPHRRAPGWVRHRRPDRRSRPPTGDSMRSATSRPPSTRSPSSPASILSKKLAEDLDALVMDVKVGSGRIRRVLRGRAGLGREPGGFAGNARGSGRSPGSPTSTRCWVTTSNTLEVREAMNPDRATIRRTSSRRRPQRWPGGCSY